MAAKTAWSLVRWIGALWWRVLGPRPRALRRLLSGHEILGFVKVEFWMFRILDVQDYGCSEIVHPKVMPALTRLAPLRETLDFLFEN